jgi:hypothetical protein
MSVLPDHVHLALRGDIGQTAEQIALAFLNNLAWVLDRRPWWMCGYYAGTFGEYSMAAVRTRRPDGQHEVGAEGGPGCGLGSS